MMKKNFFISSLILFIIIKNGIASQNILSDNETEEHIPFMEKFKNGYYLSFYTILWGIMIEFSLYLILYNKQSYDYANQHTFINFCLIFGQIINNAILFQTYRLSFTFIYISIELLISILELVQILIGNKISLLKLEKNYTPSIQFNKKVHRYLGFTIYIMHKTDLCIYMFLYFFQKQIVIAFFMVLLILLIPIFHHTWFQLSKQIGDKQIKVDENDFLIQYQKNKNLYQNIITKIENNTLEDKSANKISLAEDKKILEQRKNNIKWVLIEDMIFDISGYLHPMGRFVLKQMQRRDITREYYGLKKSFFRNRKLQANKFYQHSHLSKTHQFLKNRCIGKVNFQTFIKDQKNQNRNVSTQSFNIKQIPTILHKSQKENFTWKIDLYYPEIENQKTRIFQLKDSEENFVVDLKSFWPNFFGKYFLISSECNDLDFMYFSFSLSPAYIKNKIEWISQISEISQDISKEMIDHLKQDVQKLNLFYELEKNGKMLSHCRHLCLLGQSQNFEKLKNKKLKLSKPLGGLKMESFSNKNYLFIVQDEGIYPFVDLIEFLTCKSFIEISEQKIQHFIFDKDYYSYFHNQPRIYIYLEISQEFEEEANYLILNNLRLINKQYQTDTNKKIIQILRKVIVKNSIKKSNQILLNETTQEVEDFKDIVKQLKISKSKKPDQVIVCGKDQFVGKVTKNYNLLKSKLKIL